MRRPRSGARWRRWELPAAAIMALAVAALLVVPGAPTCLARGSRSIELATASCSNGTLASVRVTPDVVSVGASSSQSFSASAWSACGTILTNLTDFTWKLSSTSVGSLAADQGTTVVYTACVAPMDGVLHLSASYNGTVRSANATIRIAGGGIGAPPVSSGALPGAPGNSASSEPFLGFALMATLIGGGVVVFLWGQRSGRSKSGP